MSATEMLAVRRGRPLAQSKHPFVAALKKKGVTVAEIAEELRRPRATVQTWYKAKDDPAYRPIPRRAAEAIRERLGVPLSAWTRIAD